MNSNEALSYDYLRVLTDFQNGINCHLKKKKTVTSHEKSVTRLGSITSKSVTIFVFISNGIDGADGLNGAPTV